ncbi:MAG: hypothetical protein NUV90_01305 [Candidatus Parcubacteria bacterium]|nr:hypothetical protein [Candidatus Parcubacteria bacterium]
MALRNTKGGTVLSAINPINQRRSRLEVITMSKFISMFVALILSTAFASSAYAEFRWKHPGGDPYATSREAAMQTRESAFRKLGFPNPVIELFMQATKVAGEKVKLSMGSRLTTMLSKGSVHQDVVIDWQAPIRGTELVAPAEKWQVTWEGKVFTAFLFEVCQNWSSIVASTPPPVATATCPWTLMLRNYSKQMLPPDLRKQEEALVALANGRSSYRGDALSRTMGRDLYYKVQPTGNDVVQVQLLDPQTMSVVEKLGTVRLVGGVGTAKLSDEQHKKVIETIWPDNSESPTKSGPSGLHLNRAFPDEWGDNPCPPRVISGVSVP